MALAIMAAAVEITVAVAAVLLPLEQVVCQVELGVLVLHLQSRDHLLLAQVVVAVLRI